MASKHEYQSPYDWLFALPLSARAVTVISLYSGANTLDELCSKTPRELSRLRGCGRKTLAEIVGVLSGIGRGLAPDRPPTQTPHPPNPPARLRARARPTRQGS